MTEKLLIVLKPKQGDAREHTRRCTVQYAMQILALATKKKLHIKDKIMYMKVPERLGDMDLVRRIWLKFRKTVPNDVQMPNAQEVIDAFKDEIINEGKLGWGIVKKALEEQAIGYELCDLPLN
jgi:hypothetical protein